MNIPDYDEANLSFGPGVIHLGAVGMTPSSDVGAVNKGMELLHETEVLSVAQGSVDLIIRQFGESQTVIFSFDAFEWKLSNFTQYLGAGHVNGDKFTFGGDINFIEASLRLTHAMPPAADGTPGGTIVIDIWRARSDGDLDIDFTDEWHDFDVDFLALPATEDWGGTPLIQGEEFYRISLSSYVPPPTCTPMVLFRPTGVNSMSFGLSTLSYAVGDGDLFYAGSPPRNIVTASNGDLYICVRRHSSLNGIILFKSEDDGETWTDLGSYDTGAAFSKPTIAIDSSNHIHIGYMKRARPTTQWYYFPRYVEWNGSAFVNGKTNFLNEYYASANINTNAGIAVNSDNVVCFAYTKCWTSVSGWLTKSRTLISGTWGNIKKIIDRNNDEGTAENRRQEVSMVAIGQVFHAFTKRMDLAGCDVWHFSTSAATSWNWAKHTVTVFGAGLRAEQGYQAISDGSGIHVVGIHNTNGNVLYRHYSAGSWGSVETVDSRSGNYRVSVGVCGEDPIVTYVRTGGVLVVMRRISGVWTLYDTFASGVDTDHTPEPIGVG